MSQNALGSLPPKKPFPGCLFLGYGFNQSVQSLVSRLTKLGEVNADFAEIFCCTLLACCISPGKKTKSSSPIMCEFVCSTRKRGTFPCNSESGSSICSSDGCNKTLPDRGKGELWVIFLNHLKRKIWLMNQYMKFLCICVRFTIKYTLEGPNMQHWYSIRYSKGNIVQLNVR